MYNKYFLFMFSVSSLVSFSLGWLRCWCSCRPLLLGSSQLTYSIWISERRPFMPVDRYFPIIIIIITLMIVLEFKAFAVSVNCGCRARANGFCLCGGTACQTAPKHLSCTVVLRCGSGVCHSGTEAAHQHWHSSRLTQRPGDTPQMSYVIAGYPPSRTAFAPKRKSSECTPFRNFRKIEIMRFGLDSFAFSFKNIDTPRIDNYNWKSIDGGSLCMDAHRIAQSTNSNVVKNNKI